MESAHITKAHEHVRNAATATYGNSIATAGHEHDSAASAFHEAAHDTANSEALRILNLLEDHHRKLAGLIKEPPRKEKKNKDGAQPTESSTTSPSSVSPRAPSRRRLPQSSIATNLAEKRGIPGVRRSTPVSATNALAGRAESPQTPVRDMLERQSRRDDDKRRISPPSSLVEETGREAASGALSSSEDNFRRFYSVFGGVISAISAPLAFTSLPLSPAPPTPQAEPAPKKQEKTYRSSSRNQSPEASRTVKSSEPDLAALISKPALRALQEANTPHFANNESFYLVPTSGGTVSYANILQNPNAPLQHPHHAAQNPHLDPISEADNESGSVLKTSSHEEFVDARETVGPPSPTTSRRPRSRKSSTSVASARTLAAGRGAGQKTVEEYELQIETLLQTVDKQSERIAMWETASQSSHIALAQSFRARSVAGDPSALAQALSLGSNAIPPTLPSPPAPGTAHSPTTAMPPPLDPEMAKRIAHLEATVSTQAAQINHLATDKEQLARQNEKNVLVLGRYREQWEKLKAGARKKQLERTERRVADMKGGVKDSDSGTVMNVESEAEVETEAAGDDQGEGGDDAVGVEEPGFGKA